MFLINIRTKFCVLWLIHSVVCLTTGPHSLLQQLLCSVRSSAPSFNFQDLLFALSSHSSCLRLLLSRLPLTSILPSTFPSITCFRRQLLRKMWPIPLLFLPFTVFRIFLPSWPFVILLYFSHDPSNWFPSSPAPRFKTFHVFIIYLTKLRHHTRPCSKCSTFTHFFLKIMSNFVVKKSSCWMLLLPWQSWI
jgi:hypothetical protein